MKSKIIMLFLIALFATQLFAQKKKDTEGKKMELKSEKEKVSYCFGLDIANYFKKSDMDLDLDILVKAMKDIFSNNPLLISQEEAPKILQDFQKKIQDKAADKSKKEGDTFCADNKKKEGVIELKSGLQYKILKEGTGPKPTLNDTVVCHYIGKFTNDTEFDNSVKRGEPATFPVKGVIPGWIEALQLMPVGSKWQLVIPASLGYGERGAGQVIPPNATLVFEIELLDIKK